MIADSLLKRGYSYLDIENAESGIYGQYIDGSVIDNITMGGSGIDIEDSPNLTISNNTIDNFSSYGIRFYNCDYSNVSGNHLSTNSCSYAIYGDNADSSMVENNIISVVSGSGIYADNYSVANYNEIEITEGSNNPPKGIQLSNSIAKYNTVYIIINMYILLLLYTEIT